MFAMSFWAVIAVEVIHPLAQEVAEQGVWKDCPRCSGAFSSVFTAMLTLFQTVVAGDSWGLVAMPVIEAFPGTAAVFAGALLTMGLGLLNLIVVVMVDSFAEKRAKDIISRADDMDCEEIEEKTVLGKIFDRIDEDGSGELSFEELEQGARKVAEFRHWLRVLDIDAKDLRQLFFMVDEDGSGSISVAEFIDTMYRMKNTESRTAAKFVKHLVTKIDAEHQHLQSCMTDVMQSLTKVTEGEVVRKSSDGREEWTRIEDMLEREAERREDVIRRALELAVEKASQAAIEKALHTAMGDVQIALGFMEQSLTKLDGRNQCGLRDPLGRLNSKGRAFDTLRLDVRHLAKPPIAPEDPALSNHADTPVVPGKHRAWGDDFGGSDALDSCSHDRRLSDPPASNGSGRIGPLHPEEDSGLASAENSCL